jgi:transcriptional regulator with XRE-family HTH domain
MTPAEFDTRRRMLGLSVEETAGLCGVQDRTIRRWVSGITPIPDDAMSALETLEDAMDEAASNAANLASQQPAGTIVTLWRYRPATDQAQSPHASSLPLGAHAIMIGWTADILETMDVPCEIHWAV